MSRVSCAMRCCASGFMWARVRMLCVRSASLTRMTRMSLAIATSILRKFSACFSSCDLERVDEVGLARLPDLPLVDLGAVNVGLLDQVQIGFRPVGIDPLEDVVEPGHLFKKSRLAHGRAGRQTSSEWI